MYIKTLEIENLRCFEKAEIELSPNINIIVGHNNSGKSSIIKALYKFQDNNSLNKTDIRVTKPNYSIQIFPKSFTENDLRIGIPNLGNDEFKNQIYIFFEQFDNTSLSRIVTFDYNVPTSKKKKIFDQREFKGFPQSEDQNNFIYPFLAKRKAPYYSSIGREDTFLVLDNLRNLAAKIKKVSSISRIKERFKELCLDILGFEITGAIPGNNNEGDKVGIYAGVNNSTISIEAMGEGVANIVGLIVILLTENGKLFLIEELENDLHPLALKKLLNLIREKSDKNQFVISTHSNIVLKYLGALSTTKIFYTESDFNDSYIPTSTITEIENTPQERLRILDELGYEIMDYEMHKGYLILEESSAERIIRDFLIPNFVQNLNGKLRMIAAGGISKIEAKFDDFNNLFLYLHLGQVYKGKAWVITDGDNVGKEVVTKLQEKYEASWSKEHFNTFSKENFEEFYPEFFQKEVAEVLAIKDKKTKKDKKKELLDNVLKWIEDDIERAKEEFAKSAKEVIEILDGIAWKL